MTESASKRVYLNRPYQPFECPHCGMKVVYLRTYKSKKVAVLWDSLDESEKRMVTTAGAVELRKNYHLKHE